MGRKAFRILKHSRFVALLHSVMVSLSISVLLPFHCDNSI